MKNTTERLEALLNLGSTYVSKVPESELVFKPNPSKWSKKQILGHLIDSAINNLQRFTEIQFETKPYKIRPYSQEGLVNANDYQNSKTAEIVALWVALNNRIVKVISLLNESTLNFEIEFDNGKISDLRFLVEDYVDHLEYHLNQIVKK